MSEGYNFSLTTFSSSGKLGQIENALAAVSQGAPCVGIRATNGAVIITEKKPISSLVDQHSYEKICKVCPTIGIVYSGIGPDMRVVLKEARKQAQSYYLTYGEYPPTKVLVQSIASQMQEFTQSGGVRPFGISVLVVGWDAKDGIGLYQVDPSGSFFAWKAAAIGKSMSVCNTFLERRYNDKIELEDAIHTAMLAMKEAYDGQMTEDNIEIGIVSEKRREFYRLSNGEIKDYLENL